MYMLVGSNCKLLQTIDNCLGMTGSFGTDKDMLVN